MVNFFISDIFVLSFLKNFFKGCGLEQSQPQRTAQRLGPQVFQQKEGQHSKERHYSQPVMG